MMINRAKAFPRVLIALGLILIVQLRLQAQSGSLVTYPAPQGLTASSDLKVNVGGKSIWTERVGGEGMEALQAANLSCSGPQTVTIEAPANIGKYVIRPKALGIAAKVNGKTLSFTIPGPQKLYVEIDQLPHLVIFANPLESNAPKADGPNLRFFGPGAHDAGELQINDGETIYIAGGAVVNAKSVTINRARNAKIIGRGVLNVASGVNIDQSENIEVSGVFIRLGGSTPVNTITGSSNVAFRNVKIFSYQGLRYADGIAVVSSKNVDIDDCFIRTRGDAVSVRTPQGEPAEAITVSKSVLAGWAYGDGFTIGFATRGPIQNVLMKDCDILCSNGQNDVGGHSAFSIICNDGGAISNVRFENIRVEENQGMKNFELNITEGNRNGNRNRTGALSAVYLKNVSWENPRMPFVIAGIPTQGGHMPTDITFDNCTVGGKPLTNLGIGDFRVEYARDIKFIPSTPMTRKIVSQE